MLGHRVMPMNIEIKGIMNEIKSLENRRFLVQETTENVNQKERFLGPLMRVGLQWIKHLLAPFPKSVLMPLGLKATASAKDAAIQKRIYWWNERYHENS